VVVDDIGYIRLQQGGPRDEPEAVVTVRPEDFPSLIAAIESALRNERPA
jgi:hypothetical protein